MLYKLPAPKTANHFDYTDTNWRLLVSDANNAYHHKEIDRARALYEDALAEATFLYEMAYQGKIEVPVAVLYVISCHNRADLARIEGDMARARQEATNAFERLVMTAEDPMAPLTLRRGAIQNLGKALAYLGELSGNDPDAHKVLDIQINRARSAAFSVFKVTAHADHAHSACNHCDVFQ